MSSISKLFSPGGCWLVLAVFALAFVPAPHALAESARAAGFTALPQGAKVVLMPMDVELFVVSAGGVMEPQAQWTEQALKNLREAFEAREATARVDFEELADKDDPDMQELIHLHQVVGAAINIHHLGQLKLPTKGGKFDWTLGPEVALIRERSGADYALFTFMRDTYASGERVAAMVIAAVFGVGLHGGFQIGYASLVDLHTGDVVWFNRLVRQSGDLREFDKARETLDALLEGFPG